ncbi:MAG: 3'-5' exonuclease [Thermomicrobiales bacterium]|nr:MAG: 3'-5' exonuclease [Thermomicrobiales bacterium]
MVSPGSGAVADHRDVHPCDARNLSVSTASHRRARAEVSAWARRRISDPATIFLDTETTGLGAGAEIIDLAVVDVAGNVLIDTLIAPMAPIPPETTRVHGLVDADVAGSPSWIEVYPAFSELIHARPIVVYNAAFDRRMIAGCCAFAGFPEKEQEWHCAMLHYARFAGARSENRHSRFRYHKLSDALASFNLPAGSHRALSDAMACRALVIALANFDDPS